MPRVRLDFQFHALKLDFFRSTSICFVLSCRLVILSHARIIFHISGLDFQLSCISLVFCFMCQISVHHALHQFPYFMYQVRFSMLFPKLLSLFHMFGCFLFHASGLFCTSSIKVVFDLMRLLSVYFICFGKFICVCVYYQFLFHAFAFGLLGMSVYLMQ